MFDFYLRAGIYFFCFLIVLFGMSALDFNRFIRQGKIAQAIRTVVKAAASGEDKKVIVDILQ